MVVSGGVGGDEFPDDGFLVGGEFVGEGGEPGAGLKGGISHGETDDFCDNVTKDPVHVRDFHATILHQLGIDHQKLIFPYQGLDQKLTRVEPARVVKEILAKGNF